MSCPLNMAILQDEREWQWPHPEWPGEEVDSAEGVSVTLEDSLGTVDVGSPDPELTPDIDEEVEPVPSSEVLPPSLVEFPLLLLPSLKLHEPVSTPTLSSAK